MLIWRPVMAGHVTLSEVKDGTALLVDLMKINAILDSQAAASAAEAERTKHANR